MVVVLKLIYLKYVGQVPLSVVFLTYRVEHDVFSHLSESQRPTCDT